MRSSSGSRSTREEETGSSSHSHCYLLLLLLLQANQAKREECVSELQRALQLHPALQPKLVPIWEQELQAPPSRTAPPSL